MKKWLTAIPICFSILMLASCTSSERNNVKVTQKENMISPKLNMIKTTTTSSPYADKIIKDSRIGIVPEEIDIPVIQVSAPVIGVGRLKDGEMAVPGDGQTTGWYNLGYKPGEPGNAAIAGHVSSKHGPAVFYNLKKLKAGDEVIIKGKNNERLVFEVLEVDSYQRLEAPIDKIFGYTNRSALNLITCSGKYDPKTTQNSERLVVYTQLK